MTASRPRNAARTRADILEAARRSFALDGYDRATVRSIAAEVGVDAALVIRYFGSKEKLFVEAVDLDFGFPDVSTVSADAVAEVLLDSFFGIWDERGTFQALLRAAVNAPFAADALQRVFTEQLAPKLISAVPPDNPAQRIGLTAAFISGIAITRYILKTSPVVGLSREELCRWAAPVVRTFLVGPLPTEPVG